MLYLLGNGTIEACGLNTQGQLGDGQLAGSTTPVTVIGLPSGTVTDITAGPGISTALINGQVWDWGKNNFGQLGDGTTAFSDVPVEVALPGPVTQVYDGGDNPDNGQSLALLANGEVYGWGCDTHGQLGDGATRQTTPLPVEATALPAAMPFSAIATGGQTSYGIDANGNVWAWGDTASEQAGDGQSAGNVLTPVEVLSGATSISATADDSEATDG
jgi:alpha-tubulin suppressor-like RCC1 family protein